MRKKRVLQAEDHDRVESPFGSCGNEMICYTVKFGRCLKVAARMRSVPAGSFLGHPDPLQPRLP